MNSMSTLPIVRVAVCMPFRHLFDYLLPESGEIEALQLGMRVSVPLGKTQRVGMIVAFAETSSLQRHQLKPLITSLDPIPCLSPHLLALAEWAYHYYQHPPGDVFLGCLPTLLRQGKPATYGRNPPAYSIPSKAVTAKLTLNAAQQTAVDQVVQALNHFHCFLLHGITGSGKTEVYLQIIQQVLDQGKQALILIPEISLTPQTVERFSSRFNVPIAVFHSKLTPRERLNTWLAVRDSITPLVIGTRSAAFTPLKKCGVIIIDESHDLSFKQQEGFRYSAKDLLIMRAKIENIPIVLGSATPSLESFYNVEKQRFTLLSLPERSGVSRPPTFEVLDIRNQQLQNGLSTSLLNKMKYTLNKGEQVLLFLNRRGYAPCFMCHNCGWIADCDDCDNHLTYHVQRRILLCHYCNQQKKIISVCPNCDQKALFPLGLGTERIEETLNIQFSDYPIVRVDRDTTSKKGALEKQLAQIHSEKCRIIIGTQMLTKGHHFPKVTLVAIVDGDSGLFATDFRATERMAQLLTQVGGRAGRAIQPGTVIIQTRQPHHFLLQTLINQGYAHFTKLLLQERAEACLPPYGFLALFRAESSNSQQAQMLLEKIRQILQQSQIKTVVIRGPIPAPMEKRAGKFRAQLLLQTLQRSALHHLLKLTLPTIEQIKVTRGVRWSLDVDPLEMY